MPRFICEIAYKSIILNDHIAYLVSQYIEIDRLCANFDHLSK